MANLRTVKKQRYLKTAVLENGVKGGILYITTKEHIRDLKISGVLGGGRQLRGGTGRGDY